MQIYEQIILAALSTLFLGYMAFDKFEQWKFGWCVFYTFMAGMVAGGMVRNLVLLFS